MQNIMQKKVTMSSRNAIHMQGAFITFGKYHQIWSHAKILESQLGLNLSSSIYKQCDTR